MEDDLGEREELLNAIGGTCIRSQEQVEQEIFNQLEPEQDDSSEVPGPSSRFDQFMRIADNVRFGEKTPFQQKIDEEREGKSEGELSTSSDEENVAEDEDFVPSDFDEDNRMPFDAIEDQKPVKVGYKRASLNSNAGRPRKKVKREKFQLSESFKDDGDEKFYQERMKALSDSEVTIEPTHSIVGDFIILKSMWKKLYKYQRTGVRWLCELHEQNVGGILADEMGLGKTIQLISFFAALDKSQQYDAAMDVIGLGACLIVCPATLMQQWVKELHSWMPKCRVAIMHSTGSYKGSKSKLVSLITGSNGCSVLITSYSTFTKERKLLVKQNWHYVVLDEGHKIRNPETQSTMALKDLATPHRLILSGSPMQNSLKELWSLIDFVYPGRLGSLKSFNEKFALPITQGGYANASEIQATTAFRCALVLRDAINPFVLRRMKKDVQKVLELPSKNEQVLFCEITDDQRLLYQDYINSKECHRILKGKMDAFVGLITLRKLCNHPDLVTGGPNRHGEFDTNEDPTKEFGWFERSGKMVVVRSLLKLWKKGDHKVLMFSQSRQMLNILEQLLITDGYSYRRMDGGTNIGRRQQLVQEFNENPVIHVFLLTTRVGGLGINLTGANKVLIFDPDWNPSTDEQARERAWRIGQNRAVTIYRLISSGTIEEKIYHRQIFKKFLTNRILVNPKQRRFFKSNELHELFSLTDKVVEGTETGCLFAAETEEIHKDNFFDRNEKQREAERKNRSKNTGQEVDKDTEPEVKAEVDSDDEVEAGCLSDERRERLRVIAAKIARNPELAAPCCSKTSSTPKEKLLDGKYAVPGLVKQRKGRRSKVSEEAVKVKDADSSKDDYVLGRLLQLSGVRSAIRHDDIIQEKPSHYLIEKEAESIAKQAAASIRSRPRRGFIDRLRGTTNTVYNGESTAAEDVKPFSGKTAGGSLIEAIRARKQRQLEGCEDVLLTGVQDKFGKMAQNICEFVKKNGGSVHTSDVVNAFKDKIAVTEQSQFRAILKRLCSFNELRKEWTLRDEYR